MRQSITALRGLADDPSLLALVLVRGISSAGDWLYLAALPLLTFQLTADVALVGLTAAGRLLPWLLLSIPAGIVADRCRTRMVLLATEWSRAGLMAIMALLAAVGAPFWTIAFAAAVGAGAGTIAMPAFGRFVPEVAADERQLGRANVVASGLDSVACIIGPAIAALLIATGGLGLAFALDGLTFVAVAVVLHRIPVDQGRSRREPTPVIAAAGRTRPGWMFLVGMVARPLAMDAAVSCAAGLLMVLPVLALSAGLGADELFAGFLSVAAGAGGVAGAAVAAVFVNGKLGRGLALAAAALVAGLLSFGVMPTASVMIAGALVAAAAVVTLDTLNLTQIQRGLDPDVLGRGLGLINTSAAVWVILGSAVPTLLVDPLGLPLVILGSGVLLALLVGLALCPLPRAGWPNRVARRSDAAA